MKLKDAKKSIKGLFPSATPDQVDMAGEMLDKIPPAIAWSVLKTHKINHEFIEFSMLAEAIRTAHSRRKLDESSAENERMVDGIRRLARESWGISDYASMADEAVIMAHFESLFRSAPDGECPPMQLQLWIFQKCRQALLEIGRSAADASEIAESIVGLSREERRANALEITKSEHGRVPVLAGLMK